MSQVGRYLGGDAFVILPVGGVRITSTTPAGANVSGTDRHGMVVADWSTTDDALPSLMGPRKQGYDGRVFATGGGGIEYDGALNVDPGKTGVPLVITTPQTLIKAQSRADGFDTENRTALEYRMPIHFVASAPATDSLPPPIGAPAVVSRFVKTDINFALLPNVTLPASAPSATAALNRYRWLQNAIPNRPFGDWYGANAYERGYGTQAAQERATAMLLMCCDLSGVDATYNELLAIHTVIHGQNVLEVLKAGGTYDFNTGLGGVLPGHKLPLLVAGLLTDDAEMLEWADAAQHDVFAEDRQTVYVSAGDVATYDYIADDLNMPEWQQNPVKNPATNTRGLGDYRPAFRAHQYAAATVATLLTGGVAAWGHPAFFDYCQRTARRTIYKDAGSQLAWGFAASGEYQAPQFHKDMYLAHVPAGWDWPA